MKNQLLHGEELTLPYIAIYSMYIYYCLKVLIISMHITLLQ